MREAQGERQIQKDLMSDRRKRQRVVIKEEARERMRTRTNENESESERERDFMRKIKTKKHCVSIG